MIAGMLGEYGFEDVQKINDILREATVQYNMAKASLEATTKKQEDILHEIELGKHGRRELANLATELRDIRIERRIAKNTIQLVGPILRWQEENRTAYNRISAAVAATRKIAKEQDEAVYHMKSDDNYGEIIEHA